MYNQEEIITRRSADENKRYNIYSNNAFHFNSMLANIYSNWAGAYYITDFSHSADWIFLVSQKIWPCNTFIFNNGVGWFTYFLSFFRRFLLFFDSLFCFAHCIYSIFL